MYSYIHDTTDVEPTRRSYIILIHDAHTQYTHTYMCINTHTLDTLLPPSLPLLSSFPPFFFPSVYLLVCSVRDMEHVPGSVSDTSSSLIHQYTVYIIQRGYYVFGDRFFFRELHISVHG